MNKVFSYSTKLKGISVHLVSCSAIYCHDKIHLLTKKKTPN